MSRRQSGNRCVPGVTYHARLESRTCSAAFFDSACYRFYLIRLLCRAPHYRLDLHAYCLLPDSVHLLFTSRTPYGLANLLYSLDGSFSAYFNARFDRGTRIWSRRAELRALHGSGEALNSQKYLERLPLTTLGLSHPGLHHWSSYSRHALGDPERLLIPHKEFLEFLESGRYPRLRYREYILQTHGTKACASRPIDAVPALSSSRAQDQSSQIDSTRSRSLTI